MLYVKSLDTLCEAMPHFQPNKDRLWDAFSSHPLYTSAESKAFEWYIRIFRDLYAMQSLTDAAAAAKIHLRVPFPVKEGETAQYDFKITPSGLLSYTKRSDNVSGNYRLVDINGMPVVVETNYTKIGATNPDGKYTRGKGIIAAVEKQKVGQRLKAVRDHIGDVGVLFVVPNGLIDRFDTMLAPSARQSVDSFFARGGRIASVAAKRWEFIDLVDEIIGEHNIDAYDE